MYGSIMSIELTLNHLKYSYYLKTMIFPKNKPKPNPEVWDFSYANSKMHYSCKMLEKNFQFSWIEVFAMETS